MSVACLIGFMIETGRTTEGWTVRWLADWPHYELFAFLTIPPLTLANRPLPPSRVIGGCAWIATWIAVFTYLSDDPWMIPILAIYLGARARAHFTELSDEDRSRDFARVTLLLLPSLFISFLAGMVLTGFFGTPITTSAEFHDPEALEHLQWRDWTLASGFVYFALCVGIDAWLRRDDTNPAPR